MSRSLGKEVRNERQPYNGRHPYVRKVPSSEQLRTELLRLLPQGADRQAHLSGLYTQRPQDRGGGTPKKRSSNGASRKRNFRGPTNLDSFDFNHSAGITRMQLGQLREAAWLDQMYNIILMGPSGTGKTYITGGLIRDAVLKGYKAQFIPMDQFGGNTENEGCLNLGNECIQAPDQVQPRGHRRHHAHADEKGRGCGLLQPW